MIILKAYRFLAYPTPEQDTLFRKTAGCRRFVYNACLEQRSLEWHRNNPRRLDAYSQINELPAAKAAFAFLAEVPSHVLQQAVIDCDRAFKRFFAGLSGYPKPKKRHNGDSFRYPDPKQLKFEQDRVFLPKAGWVAYVQHRPIIGKIKNVTVSRTADQWFLSVQCEVEIAVPAPVTGEAIGIDIGVAKPMALSTGEIIMLPRTTETERRRLGSLQKRLARRKKGSANRRKAQMAVARYQAKLARRRKDAAHKATTRIAKNHGIIVVEDLKVRNMTASAAGTVEEPGRNVRAKAGLNRSLLDVSPRQIREMLEYKAGWYGSKVVAVSPAYTSQECSECGYVHADNRITQADFVCGSCGYTKNADVNAAKNIKKRGTGGLPEMVCGSNRTSGRKQKSVVAKRRSPAVHGGE